MPRAKSAKRTTRTTGRRGTPGAAHRARLIRDVEELWCALSSAVALFQTRSAALRGLTLTDLQAIDMLAREDVVCASDLAEECGLTRGAITGMLNRLERAGVVRRWRDEDDARRLVIRAVQERAGAECRIPQTFQKVAASFSDDDLQSIRRFLRESAEALRRETATMSTDK